MLVRPARQAQVVQCLLINGEESDGGAIFRCHIGHGCPISQGERIQPGAEELHELLNDTHLAKYLRDRKHQVGCRAAFRQVTCQSHADDIRGDHDDRLSQHGRLGLNASNPPTEDAQSIDHRGVGICAHHRVGEQ